MSFARACAADEVREDEPLGVTVGDMEIALARQGEEYFAIQDLCSHAEVALSEGDVEDCTIECWLHGSQFDLRSGQPTSLPATTPIDVFTVNVDDGTVYVDVAAPTNSPRKES